MMGEGGRHSEITITYKYFIACFSLLTKKTLYSEGIVIRAILELWQD
jgi:hypothetical protein